MPNTRDVQVVSSAADGRVCICDVERDVVLCGWQPLHSGSAYKVGMRFTTFETADVLFVLEVWSF